MSKILVSYLFLAGAITAEIFATSFLAKSQQFTIPIFSIATVLGYVCSFYCLSQALKVLPIGIAYAIWCGVGIVAIAAIGFFVFGQKLDLPACAGIGLIIAGVLVINLFSHSVSH